MIVHEVTQGSREWLALRAGRPTASQFHRIITPKRASRSEQMEGYINDMVAERILGRPLATPEMPWMKDGIEREPEAAAYYSFIRDVELEVVGFCTTDDGKIGASPDRLVGKDGIVEIKCPKPSTQIAYLLGSGPDETYKVQLQGQLLVTEREWADIISYYPGMPEAIVRVERDEPFIAKLRELLYEAVAQVEERIERLKAGGWTPREEVEGESSGQWLISDEDIEALATW